VFVDFGTNEAGESLGLGGYNESDVEVVDEAEQSAKSKKR
jgi:hypothetical protein